MDDHCTAASGGLGVNVESALDASVAQLVLEDSADLVVADAADEGALAGVDVLQHVVGGSDGVER